VRWQTSLPAVGLIVLSAGCAGQSTARRIAAQATIRTHAVSASCTKVGIILFVGQRQDVYDCRLEHVDVAHRPVSQIESPTIHLCYVYASGAVYDVTSQLGTFNDAGADTSSFPCVRGSSSICPDDLPPVAQRPTSNGRIEYRCHDGTVVTK
jgi:hypothetical protein